MIKEEENVIAVYQILADPNSTSDDAMPHELIEAINELRAVHGEHPIEDYAEAVDWASYLVSREATASGDWKEGLTEREGDCDRAKERTN